MANNVFIKVDEIQEKLGVSERESYRIIAKLNEELAAKGYLVVRGRTNRKYLEEKLYDVNLEETKELPS